MAFRFKQFSVDDHNCPMKVGTDSVLLGSWAEFNNALSILDIGTGCGLLALMSAQKSKAQITAIDIDATACIQALENFSLSPWSERLTCHNVGIEILQEFLGSSNSITSESNSESYNTRPEIDQSECDHIVIDQPLIDKSVFDHIITNPPYFLNSLKSPDKGRNKARHIDDLRLEVLVEKAAGLLSSGGKLSMVFPHKESQLLISLASFHDLNVSRKLNIIPKEGKSPNRILLEFTKGTVNGTLENDLTIRDHEGNYTHDYRQLTGQFYLHLT